MGFRSSNVAIIFVELRQGAIRTASFSFALLLRVPRDRSRSHLQGWLCTWCGGDEHEHGLAARVSSLRQDVVEIRMHGSDP